MIQRGIEDLLPNEIKVIIADDHEIVRAGIRRILSLEKRIKIVAEAENGKVALSLINQYQPDLVLLDINMPQLDGIELARMLKSNNPEIVVLMLTALEDYQNIERALAAGADGYLSKDVSPNFLIEAIYKSILGERVFSKSILRVLEAPRSFQSESDNSNVALTKREQEILNYVATGKTSQEIAEILGISVRTVQNHRANIMQKLGIKTAAGLVRFAVIFSTKQREERLI
ncbi:DNA-binding response regulator [Bacteroidetes/Chlorobi group bacterium Naka2016]|jgi:DNA-binding NarL/FixJ family response regulator|nr:MAG: DNA-binding response regulator [Bacteroidetes/Chlorobi group bacterium Naka2016]